MLMVPNPPKRPSPKAAKVLPNVKCSPSWAELRMNISGSINGDDNQNAMTGAKGTPALKSPAMMGMTPHEQKGERVPNAAAAAIIFAELPENTRAISFSDPLAFAAAAMATERPRKGEICISDQPTNCRLSNPCVGVKRKRTPKSPPMAKTTGSIRSHKETGEKSVGNPKIRRRALLGVSPLIGQAAG